MQKSLIDILKFCKILYYFYAFLFLCTLFMHLYEGGCNTVRVKKEKHVLIDDL